MRRYWKAAREQKRQSKRGDYAKSSWYQKHTAEDVHEPETASASGHSLTQNKHEATTAVIFAQQFFLSLSVVVNSGLPYSFRWPAD